MPDTTPTQFLLARIAEDEKAARAATEGPWEAHSGAYRMASLVRGDVWIGDIDHDPDVYHIARHDPARVLAECEAKRRIVEDFEEYASDYRAAPSDFAAGRRHAALLALTRVAAVYADHPDYDPGWKP